MVEIPTTQTEYEQIYSHALGDALALLAGLMRKFIPEDKNLELYLGFAGDESPEVRRKLGLLTALAEHQIDREISKRRHSIEKCYRFALKSTTTEERDYWNDKIRVHVAKIDRANDLRIQVRKILAVGSPWIELLQASLMHTRTGVQPNAAFVPPSLQRQLDQVLSQIAQLAPAPPPPATSPTPKEGDTAATDSSARTDAE